MRTQTGCQELLATFIPTRRQLVARMQLHRLAAPQTIAKLTTSNLSSALGTLLGEQTVNDVTAWCQEDPSFFFWMVSPEESELALYQARAKAAKVITDIIDMDSGGDVKVLALQYQAAKNLLEATAPPQPQVVKNTVNLRAATSNIPKRLSSKTAEELEQELRVLKGNP
jgi:hypothetical protein